MNNISKQVRAKVTGYILAAFGLVAGLAWNDAVKSMIDRFFPLDQGNVILKFAYALTIKENLASTQPFSRLPASLFLNPTNISQSIWRNWCRLI